MQPGVRRFLLARLRPALLLAALAPVAPALAGEVAADAPAAPWQRLPADDGEAGFRHYPAGFRGRTGFELVLREADEGVPWRGLFFRAGGGLRIGAQGSFDAGSGNLRAIVALKLDF